MSTEEINLEDDTEFDRLFNDWQVKTILAQRLIDESTLRTICRIWYGRGIARGTEWTNKEITRLEQQK